MMIKCLTYTIQGYGYNYIEAYSGAFMLVHFHLRRDVYQILLLSSIEINHRDILIIVLYAQ